jgi:hypothetical protein
LKKDKSLKLENGYVEEIKSIEKDGRAVIKMETGKDKTINHRYPRLYRRGAFIVQAPLVQCLPFPAFPRISLSLPHQFRL